ncbi:MAG TPA: S8 family serine peptidase [Anaerolineales bacterium]|nr:S8 family serine peptidase [Anaerolineales bacterium]
MTFERLGRVLLAVVLMFSGLRWLPTRTAHGAIGRLSHKEASLALARRARANAFAAISIDLASSETVRVIVRLNTRYVSEAGLSSTQADAQQARLGSTAEALRLEIGADVDHFRGLTHLPYAIAVVDAGGLARLAASSRVAGVQADRPDTVQLDASGGLIGASGAGGAHALGYTGSGYAVAILDTGVERLHPFFQDRVVAEACFSTTYSGYASSVICPNGTGEQFGPGAAQPCSVDNPDPTGACDHGTHVAGIAAGQSYADMLSDGASSDFDGVAPGADIIAVQVFSRFDSVAVCGSEAATPCYQTYNSDQLRALEWLIDIGAAYNLAAVNMSLGGSTKYLANCDADIRKLAIDALRAAGVATFIAAGNSGFTDGLASPACISSAISVGSVSDGGSGASPADAVSWFSNSAAFLSLWAPGHWIESAVLDGAFGTMAGTSMAAPHAAGAWLVLNQMYPGEDLDTRLARLLSEGVNVTDGRNGVTRPRIFLEAPLATPTPGPTGAGATATPTITPTPTGTAVATLAPQGPTPQPVYLPLLQR